MRFARDWDVKLLRWLAACPDPARSILSSYPVSFDRGETPSERKPTVLAFKNFAADRIPRFKGIFSFTSSSSLSLRNPPSTFSQRTKVVC